MSPEQRHVYFHTHCVEEMHELDRVSQGLVGKGLVGYASGRLRPTLHWVRSGRRTVRLEEVRIGPDLWFLAFKANDSRRIILRIVRGDRQDVIAEGVDAASWFQADPMFRMGSAPVARRATRFAAWLSGSRRSHLHDEWAAILAGAPEDGVVFSARRQVLLASGFLFAAVRMRMGDVARPAWRPVDWLLRTSSRTNAFITSVVGAQAIYIVGDGGLTALVTQVWEPCGIAGASLFALVRWLRGRRGIELVTPQREGADE